MGKRTQRKNGKFGQEERHQKVVSICESFGESFGAIGDDWVLLNEMAQDALSKAVSSLSEKHYKAFALHLRLYSWIWQYAYDHLSKDDYKYFCIGQDSSCADQVM